MCLRELALIFVPSSAPGHFQRIRVQCNLQNLLEESLQRLQLDLAEIGYGAEVRLMIIRRQHPEGDIFHRSPFWLVRVAAAEVVRAVGSPTHAAMTLRHGWGTHNCGRAG